MITKASSLGGNHNGLELELYEQLRNSNTVYQDFSTLYDLVEEISNRMFNQAVNDNSNWVREYQPGKDLE